MLLLMCAVCEGMVLVDTRLLEEAERQRWTVAEFDGISALATIGLLLGIGFGLAPPKPIPEGQSSDS